MNEWTVHFQARSRPIDEEFLARIGAVAEEYDVDVDSKTLQTINEAARNHKQLKSIPKRISHEDFIRLSAELSELAGPQPHDSAELIREDRDR